MNTTNMKYRAELYNNHYFVVLYGEALDELKNRIAKETRVRHLIVDIYEKQNTKRVKGFYDWKRIVE